MKWARPVTARRWHLFDEQRLSLCFGWNLISDAKPWTGEGRPMTACVQCVKAEGK